MFVLSLCEILYHGGCSCLTQVVGSIPDHSQVDGKTWCYDWRPFDHTHWPCNNTIPEQQIHFMCIKIICTNFSGNVRGHESFAIIIVLLWRDTLFTPYVFEQQQHEWASCHGQNCAANWDQLPELYAYCMSQTTANHSDRLCFSLHLSPFICQR